MRTYENTLIVWWEHMRTEQIGAPPEAQADGNIALPTHQPPASGPLTAAEAHGDFLQDESDDESIWIQSILILESILYSNPYFAHVFGVGISWALWCFVWCDLPFQGQDTNNLYVGSLSKEWTEELLSRESGTQCCTQGSQGALRVRLC